MVDFRRMRWLINRLPGARMRIDRARSRASKVTQVLSDMPHGADVGSPVENGYELIEDAEAYYHEIKNELKHMKNELAPMIDKIKNKNIRRTLILRYIKEYSVRKIAFELAFSEPRIYQLLKIGEREISKIEKRL